MRESVRYRRAALSHVADLEREVALRQSAEQQLDVLINTSPAGIVTVSPDGIIVLANHAAHRIFGVELGALTGERIRNFVPLLDGIQQTESPLAFRTELECRARRGNGDVFLAHVWISTFTSMGRPTLAAIILDASEELRDREQTALNQLLAGSRIMVGAVSHEIRNFAGAIAVVHANLERIAGLRENEDFKALGGLVEGLRAVASSNLLMAAEGAKELDLRSVFDDFRIIVQAAAEEAHCQITYDIPSSLPHVRGDHQRLLQVLLNLANNSFRALQHSSDKSLSISVASDSDTVAVQFRDSGPGVSRPELLFRPFQQRAESSGLGLYVSRAIVRSFAGELRYQPEASGACFVIELVPTSLNGNAAAGETTA